MTDEPNQQSQDEESSDGAFGQEDIDALMNQGGESEPAPEESSAPAEGAEQAGGGAVSQGDIDALVNQESGSPSVEETSERAQEPVEAVAGDEAGQAPVADQSEEAAGGGAVSQSDIDALMNQGGESGPAAEAPDAPGESMENAGGGAVSQSDIDALMNGVGSAEPEAPVDAAPDERLDSLGRPFDEAAAAMQAAMDEEAAASGAASTSGAGPEPASLELGEIGPTTQSSASVDRMTMLNDVNLNVEIELGRTRMLVEDVLALGEGSVVELEKLAGDPVDIFVNERLIARGEVLVLNDNFCVRISEVLSNDPHRIST